MAWIAGTGELDINPGIYKDVRIPDEGRYFEAENKRQKI
jgi:hypothetical protein